MMGQAFLVTFAATGKSDTLSRAEQMHQKNTSISQAKLLKNHTGLPIHYALKAGQIMPELRSY